MKTRGDIEKLGGRTDGQMDRWTGGQMGQMDGRLAMGVVDQVDQVDQVDRVDQGDQVHFQVPDDVPPTSAYPLPGWLNDIPVALDNGQWTT